MKPKIGWSNFAKKRHRPETGHSYCLDGQKYVLELAYLYFNFRKPGQGEYGVNRKAVITLSKPEYASRFICPTYLIEKDMPLAAKVSRRQEYEDWKVDTFYKSPRWWEFWKKKYTPIAAKFITIVLYSKEALLENNGELSGDHDWEIVSVICSDVEKEPMNPLTMARNMLERSGGTRSYYTAQEFAESIYYWSQRVKG